MTLTGYNRFDTIWTRFIISLPLFTVFIGTLLVNIPLLYLLCFTRLWPLPLLYLIWMLTLDRESFEKGGRKKLLLRGFFSPAAYSDYFPIKFKLSSPFKLDPKRNYLFCGYPHGLIPLGAGKVFITHNTEFEELFPDHSYRIATLHNGFYVPLIREILMLVGFVSASEKSLDYLLGNPKGGNAVALFVGGLKEVSYCYKPDYHIVLKNRKGFARIALKNGTPLIPMFQFGVNNIYKTYNISWLRWMEPIIGCQPLVMNGCGLFQDWFGFAPLAHPLTTIVGEPIEVERVENPTSEEVNELHKKFTDSLVKLYDEYKDKVEPNQKNVKLVIH